MLSPAHFPLARCVPPYEHYHHHHHHCDHHLASLRNCHYPLSHSSEPSTANSSHLTRSSPKALLATVEALLGGLRIIWLWLSSNIWGSTGLIVTLGSIIWVCPMNGGTQPSLNDHHLQASSKGGTSERVCQQTSPRLRTGSVPQVHTQVADTSLQLPSGFCFLDLLVGAVLDRDTMKIHETFYILYGSLWLIVADSTG